MHDMRDISLYNALFNYFIKVTRLLQLPVHG